MPAGDLPQSGTNGWTRAAGLGEQLTARFDDYEETGIFADIDSKGLLVLDTHEGRKRISAADIFLPDFKHQS